MNVIVNPDQSDTKQGDIVAIAAEVLAHRSRLGVLVNDGAVPEIRLPDSVSDIALYLIHETGAAGDEIAIEAIQPGHNFRVKLEGACDAGEILVLADPTGDSGNDAGMVRDLPTTAGVYFSPGIAEEAGVDGQLVLVRPFPRMITVGTAFTGATPANTAATSTTPFGFSEAQANALVANVREMREALIAQGLMEPNA